jgi:hypothetical protein
MKITVNGQTYNTSASTIDYGTVLAYANEPQGASVTYSAPRKGDVQRAGILSALSQPIALEDGMVFNAIRTGNG